MSQADVVQSHLEVLMEEHLGTGDLQVEDDGEVVVLDRSGRYAVRVRAYDGREPHIEVYSIMLTGVEADPGLFEALNDLNRKLSHARAFWLHDRVVVAGEVIGRTASVQDLSCLCQEIGEAVHTEGPLLAATFGGEVFNPSEVEGP